MGAPLTVKGGEEHHHQPVENTAPRGRQHEAVCLVVNPVFAGVLKYHIDKAGSETISQRMPVLVVVVVVVGVIVVVVGCCLLLLLFLLPLLLVLALAVCCSRRITVVVFVVGFNLILAKICPWLQSTIESSGD